MSPTPFNRHILVSKEDVEKENESLVLVPEEYKEQEPFAMVKVIKAAQDCSREWNSGDRLIVPVHTIETLSYKAEKYSLVLENHVLIGFNDKE
jgi:co-chaperonin GroES (HSP10)